MAAIIELLSKVDHKTQVIWATDCAARALAYLAGKYPTDNRTEKAIEAGRAWVRGEISTGEARKAAFASHSAAREAIDDAVRMVARASGHAAATAHVAGHALHASTYAIKAIVLSGGDSMTELNWQIECLKKMIESNNR